MMFPHCGCQLLAVFDCNLRALVTSGVISSLVSCPVDIRLASSLRAFDAIW